SNGFVVDERRMLDRIDAGHHGLFDSGGAVRVSGDLASQPMSFSDDRANFLIAELQGFGRVAFREHAAARADLDAVSAVLGDLASLGHQRRDAVGNSVGLVMKLRREQALIAMASGDS